MQIRFLSIRNFRGIRECDWHIDSRLICLIGAGDTTKSTIIDAIEIALWRGNSMQVSDADFYDCDQSKAIEIQIAIQDVPDSLLSMDRGFLKFTSHVDAEGKIRDGPGVGDMANCLMIRFSVDETLDPEWSVVRSGTAQRKRISARDRTSLGFHRIGDSFETQLRWSRNSILSTITNELNSARPVMAEASREMRQTLFESMPEPLKEVAATIDAASRELGSNPQHPLRPGLDPTAVGGGHSLLLHSGEIPLSHHGLGTRRLTGIAIQEQAASHGSVMAIDEIEYGLEPHRLSTVLYRLVERAEAGKGQTFVSTHSPVAVTTLSAKNLYVVHRIDGLTSVRVVPTDLDNIQGTVRSGPSALLAKRILIGEGATEVGFLRRFLQIRDAEERLSDLAPTTSITEGCLVTNGGGNQAIERACHFQALGFPTALLIDNDLVSAAERAHQKDRIRTARSCGVQVVQWQDNAGIEDMLCAACSPSCLSSILQLAASEQGEDSVTSGLKNLDVRASELIHATWILNGLSEADSRLLLATALKRYNWLKNETAGEQLADLVLSDSSAMNDPELRSGLDTVYAFATLRTMAPPSI